MDRKELQEFIYFLTQSRKLSKAQQRKRDCLLARDCEPNHHETQPTINKTNNSNKKNIDSILQAHEINHRPGVDAKYTPPQNIQQFLRDYNQDPVLKYTCHLIDADEVISSINNECNSCKYDFFKHIDLIQKHFLSLRKSYKERNIFLSPNIISLIHVYLSGKDVKGESTTWSANKIDVGWGCDELISWANQNPGKIPNPGPNIVRKQKNSGFSLASAFLSETTGARIKSFSQLVIFFKSQFHIRSDNSLKSILKHVNQQSWSDEKVIFSFSKEKFNDDLELLTDVDKLIQAYKKIIDLCIKYKSEGALVHIELSFYDNLDEGHTFFEIHHQNTCYKKTLKNSIERIGETQARLIEKQINGLCDLYIEAVFSDGKGARINLWDNNPSFNYHPINNAKGVKYILRF